MPKIFLDIIRWLSITAATVLAVRWLCTVHWALGLVLAFPMFVIFMNLFGLLILPFYAYTTEARNANRFLHNVENESQRSSMKNSPSV